MNKDTKYKQKFDGTQVGFENTIQHLIFFFWNRNLSTLNADSRLYP